MIFDSAEGISDHDYDVCVIGSGPVGITVSLELARQNKRVLLLESGARQPSPDIQALSAASRVNTKTHDDPLIITSRQLGGTSNLWGARCQPYDPVDFADRPNRSGARWPIAHEDLADAYARACAYANCGEPVFVEPLPGVVTGSNRIDINRLERFSNKPAFQNAHKEDLATNPRLDICLNSTVVDIGLAENGRARSVVVHDDRTGRTEIPARQVVIAMGGNESTRLLLSMQRANPSLFGGEGGPLGRYYMGHLIGEVSDVVFNNEAVDRAFDFYVDAHGSYVRRRLIPSDEAQIEQALPNVSFWPVVPTASDASHRSSILSMVVLALSIGPLGRLLVAEVIRQYHAPKGLRRLPHILNIVRDIPSAMIYAPTFLYKRYMAEYRMPGFFLRNPARRYGLSYHAEQLPNPDSRLTLGAQCDRTGLPMLDIDLRFQREDAEALTRAHVLLGDWLAESGLGRLEYRQPLADTADAILDTAMHGTHQIGTIRMGLDRQSAIVDRNLKTFDIDNLHVASTAVLPTSGQANPTLTAVALGVRLADHLARA